MSSGMVWKKCDKCSGEHSPLWDCHHNQMREHLFALEDALAVVKDRGSVYGPPREDMARIAKLWSAFLGVDIAPAQVPACMMLVKLSRLAQTPNHRDSFVDIAGYVHCYEDCIDADPQ